MSAVDTFDLWDEVSRLHHAATEENAATVTVPTALLGDFLQLTHQIVPDACDDEIAVINWWWNVILRLDDPTAARRILRYVNARFDATHPDEGGDA